MGKVAQLQHGFVWLWVVVKKFVRGHFSVILACNVPLLFEIDEQSFGLQRKVRVRVSERKRVKERKRAERGGSTELESM